MTELRFSEYKPSEILRGHLKLGGADPAGRRIDVNSLYIERDGMPWIGVMGEYHYVRDRRENWARELAKMRAGGITAVSTYVFWIYHEESEGSFDFTGDRDLRKFVADAQNAGLDVIIRIGPWCHGETRNGGLPDWILKKPFKVRDNNPGYMKKAEIWYRHIYEQVKGLFYRDGGPIIGVQIENELVDNAEHLSALKRLAQSVGFDVPLWTATGWNSCYGAKMPVDEFLPVFGGYADAPWAETVEELPPSVHFTFNPTRNEAAVWVDPLHDTDSSGWRLPYERYPFATCELGPGLQPTYHRRPAVAPMDAYSMGLAKLGCGNNLMGWYMYHGGINKIGALSTLQESRATGYPNDLPILDYGFQACISPYGEIGETYRLLNLLHLFVQDFGHILAPMEHVPAEKFAPADDTETLRYAMRTDGSSGFIFVNHHQRHMKLRDMKNVSFRPLGLELPPIDVKGDTAFILPFGLNLGGETLEWATAQLICREKDEYYFAALPNIKPRFKFKNREILEFTGDGVETLSAGSISVTVLSMYEAKYLRRLETGIVLGSGLDLYEFQGEQLASGEEDIEDEDLDELSLLDGCAPAARLTTRPCPPPFEPRYSEELRLGGDRPVFWRRLTVTSPRGFVTVPTKFDVAQLYVNGVLTADKFSDRLPWRLPASMLYQNTCHIAYTTPTDSVYTEPKT